MPLLSRPEIPTLISPRFAPAQHFGRPDGKAEITLGVLRFAALDLNVAEPRMNHRLQTYVRVDQARPRRLPKTYHGFDIGGKPGCGA